jgi:peptide deformylase
MKIAKFGNPVLRRKGERIGEITAELKELAFKMIETMREADGIGLAAQQVGLTLQLCVVDLSVVDDERTGAMFIDGEQVQLKDYMPMIMINPEIKDTGNGRVVATGGCLSFPDIIGEVSRERTIRVKTRLLSGKSIEFEATGLFGRAIQHEHDHLHGVLFIDRMSSAEKAALAGRVKRIKKEGEAQALEEKENAKGKSTS